MIDVVMPCYNSEDTIKDVLDGLHNQEYQNFSLHIVDNASTDKTIKAIKSHPIFEKTNLIQNNANIGFVRNVRKAFELGSHEYTAICSSNDTLYPEYLSKLIELHDDNTSLTYTLPDFFINERFAKKASPEEYFETDGLDPVESCNLVMRKFTYSSPFWGLYKKKSLTMMSPFPFWRGADHVFVAEAALYGNIRMVPRQLFKRRYPAERTLESFSLMENDRYLTTNNIQTTVSWHLFPHISMIRSHHNMIRQSYISEDKKETLLKSSTEILTRRYQSLIIGELKRFSALKKRPPKAILDKQYFHEIESYISFIENYVRLEKKQ